MKRRVLLFGALSGALAGSAWADDLTVSTGLNTPQRTSAAKNGTPGNIIIESNGSVSITTPGAAVTVDSSNTLTSAGQIANSSASGPVGIHILGGITSAISVTGSVSAGASDTSTGSFGVLLDGPGTFTGGISFTNPSSINVLGAGATGMALLSPIAGNVTQGATMTGFGAGATGLLAKAPIDGFLTNAGNIVVGGTATFDVTKIDPEAGSGIAIGASITHGFQNAGPATADDTTVSAGVTTIGSRPAVYISPSVAGSAAADLTLGLFDDATVSGFSFINRGSIAGGVNDPGLNINGLRIEGSGAFATTLVGGIYNRGTIRADSTSSNLSATSVSSAAANATALAIGPKASVPYLQNEGVITATTAGPAGGQVTGLLIEAGGSLPQIINTSFITGIGNTSDPSITNLSVYGIRDLSGTLTKITNFGTISAAGTQLDAGSVLVAADLSNTTAAITFNNSGSVLGTVAFGKGANSFVVDGTTAVASGRFHATAGGTLDIDVKNGKFQSDATQATNVSLEAGSTTEFSLNQKSTAAPLITATNNVDFATGAKVTLAPTSFLPDAGNYTLVTAAGALTFGNFAASTQLPVPFLFTGGFTHDDHNLFLTLTRKPASALGLSGNLAAIYEPASAAATLDNDLGQHLLALDSAASVQETLGTMLPQIGVGSRALMVAATDQATGPIGGRQRALVTQPKQGLGFWSQQFYNDVNSGTSANTRSYFGSGYGVAMGAEWGTAQTGRLGVGYTYFTGQVTEKFPRTSKEDVSVNMLSAYGGWRAQNFFFTPQANAGIAFFTGRRLVTVGGFSRTSEADWTAYMASGGFSTGYVMNFGPVQVIPQISVDGLYMHQGKYAESGGGQGIDLNVGSVESRSLRLFAGVVAQGAFRVEDGVLQPQVLAGWSHEFLDNTPVIDASFQALPGSPFALVGPTAEPSRVIGGASFSYVFNNWSAGLNYDAARTSGSMAQSATVMVTSRF